MAYRSNSGRRPDEWASKASHSPIINDPEVAAFLSRCHIPDSAEPKEIPKDLIYNLDEMQKNPINFVIAIDGGYTDVPVRDEYPSATISFLQFGALFFSMRDLEEIAQKPFIDPSDMAKLNEIERFKFPLPTKNITLSNQTSLTHSIRVTLFEFLALKPEHENTFLRTLSWFLFREYLESPHATWPLASCPHCNARGIVLTRAVAGKVFREPCSSCGGEILLTDVFRLHEAVDDEIGASGILGYTITLMEQIVLVHLFRTLLSTKPALLKETLFIKDGPLGFFGQTANLHAPMRDLTNYLMDKHDLFLVGLEKSGAFVEHADAIKAKLYPGTVLLPDNKYIYSYIKPGVANAAEPYGRSSLYGTKMIYKSPEGRMYVASLPTKHDKVVLKPTSGDFKNLNVILQNLNLLKCDMYDNALFPIALANKLVSLSNHPSAVILEKFAKETLGT